MKELLRAAIAIALLFAVYGEAGPWTTTTLALIFVILEIQKWREE